MILYVTASASQEEAGLHPGKLHACLLTSLQSKPIAFLNGIAIPLLNIGLKRRMFGIFQRRLAGFYQNLSCWQTMPA